MTEKYGFMPGTAPENRENPKVRSKFDKSQGRGLPAPHLSHPGATAKVTGSSHPGHTENGHKLPVERMNGVGGIGARHYSPGEMGAPILKGQGMGGPKNTHMTDANVVKSSIRHFAPEMAPHEPDPVRAGGDLHKGQHNTAKGNDRLGGTENTHAKAGGRQKMEDSSKRTAGGHAELDRVKMKGRS